MRNELEAFNTLFDSIWGQGTPIPLGYELGTIQVEDFGSRAIRDTLSGLLVDCVGDKLYFYRGDAALLEQILTERIEDSLAL